MVILYFMTNVSDAFFFSLRLLLSLQDCKNRKYCAGMKDTVALFIQLSFGENIFKGDKFEQFWVSRGKVAEKNY